MSGDSPAGSQRSPATLFEDAIKRALGWVSEEALRALVEHYTGVKLSLTEANTFSQEVAELVIAKLRAHEEPSADFCVGDLVQHRNTRRSGRITKISGSSEIMVDHTGPYSNADFKRLVPE